MDNEMPFTPPVPVSPEGQTHSGQVNIQVLSGSPAIKDGHVALVFHNVPISPVSMPDGTELLVPCVQMTARQAMELALNIIYIAKIAEHSVSGE